jgi:sugar phosphate isomerase/epimerase
MDTSQIAITTSEISLDPITALEIGTSWGIHNYELKVLLKSRVPRIPEEDLARLEEAADAYDARFVAVSPGLFIGTEWQTPEAAVQSEEILPETIAFAQRFAADKIVVFAGRRPTQAAPDEACPDTGIAALREAATRAQAEGLLLVLENLAGSWADTAAHALDVLERVGHPAFRLNWDPGNAFAAGDSVPYPDGYRLLKDWVRHVHIKDAQADESDLGFHWEPILSGQIDWRGQIAALNADGYEGALLIETHCPPQVHNSHINHMRLIDLLSGQ